MNPFLCTNDETFDATTVKCTDTSFQLFRDAMLLWKRDHFLSSPAASGRSSNEKRITNSSAQSQSIAEAFALCLRISDRIAW